MVKVMQRYICVDGADKRYVFILCDFFEVHDSFSIDRGYKNTGIHNNLPVKDAGPTF